MSPVRYKGSSTSSDSTDSDSSDDLSSYDPKRPTRPATLAMHADDPLNLVDDVAPPLHLSTTFRYAEDPAKLVSAVEAKPTSAPTDHVYSRISAPNTTRLEAILSSLLKAPSLTYSSGLSALYALLTFLAPKNVSIGDGYHGCHGVVEVYQRLAKCKKHSLACATSNLGKGDLIILETPVNPTGEAFDIAKYAKKAHSRGAYLVVDSTFAPPPLQNPFALGADIVMHSGTKYIGGHSDMLCGVLAVKDEDWIPKMKHDRLFLGSVMGSLEGWLGVRSVRTMELRVQRQSQSATKLAQFFSHIIRGWPTHLDQVTAARLRGVLANVTHASLQVQDDDEDAETWLTKQMPGGFGPVFSITLKKREQARKLPSKLEFFHHATSLGGVESLIEWRTMSDNKVDPRLLRLSIGIEDVTDLRDDLVKALLAVAGEENNSVNGKGR